jgi:hypothetical protein
VPATLKLSLVMLCAAALVTWVLAAPARADAILDWNAKAEAIATEKRSSPFSRAQALAIVHLAMFEAINALELQNNMDKRNISADQNTSVDAAAAAAAHSVLVILYPELATDLTSALVTSLAKLANGVPKARGFLVGKKAAAAVLELWVVEKRISAVHPPSKN